MIEYRLYKDTSCYGDYDKIPQRYIAKSIYKINKINKGLGGIIFEEVPVTPYERDFAKGSSVNKWSERFDISKWVYFVAYNENEPVGGIAIANKTSNVFMLEGRDDLAVVWDLRVKDEYKGQKIGQRLWDLAKEWCIENGLKQIKVEFQNTNVPAVNFYHKQGGSLGKIDEYAYGKDCE